MGGAREPPGALASEPGLVNNYANGIACGTFRSLNSITNP